MCHQQITPCILSSHKPGGNRGRTRLRCVSYKEVKVRVELHPS